MSNYQKKDLEIVRKYMKTVSEVIDRHPDVNNYKELLSRLQQEEADIVNKIGRK